MSDVPAIVDSTLSNALQALSRALLALGPDSVSPDPRLADLITTLPRLTESDIEVDGVCPICLVSFRAHLAEEEMASVMESPAHASEDLGVTRLQSTCKHISTWIRQARNSCPTCRRPLLPPLEEPNNVESPATTSTSSTTTDPLAATTAITTSSLITNPRLATELSLTTDPHPRTSVNDNNNNEEPPSSPSSPVIQDDPETAAARLVNDVIRDVLDRLSPSGSGLTNTDLHTLLESVLPTLIIPPMSQTDSSDHLDLDLESDHDYPDRNEFSGMYS